ncbi:MAG: cation:proton antiporter, partial [Chromatiales bacterium]|nr:cation:proton antiporter [Chromatiales bacterium]
LGILLGWLAGKLVAHWKEQNRFSGLSITLLLAYSGYLLAEGLLHASGVITVLCASLAFIHTRRHGAELQEGELFSSFWGYLETMAGSVLFFALGAGVGAHEFPLTWAIPGVILILVVARCVVVYGFGQLLNWLHGPLPLSWQHVMTLGGLRGAVSAALVLMIPHDYVYRIDMLCMVFVLCLYTLVVHPPLLRLYLEKARIES